MRKILLFILAVCLLASPALATVGGWPILRKPTESWLSGSVGDPLWNWVKAADRLIELGSELGTGSVFYVNSNVTTEGDGSSWENAVDTFAEAVIKCATGAGDFIIIAEGHNEGSSSADLFYLYRPGVTVTGKGKGALRPTFDSEGVAVMARITATNCTVRNIIFRSSTTVSAGLTLLSIAAGADYTSVIGCEFGTPEASGEFTGFGITIAAATGVLIEGNFIDLGEYGSIAGITADGTDLCVIRNNKIWGDCLIASIHSGTTTNTRGLMESNDLWNGVHGGLNAKPAISMKATDTWISRNNRALCNVGTVAAAFVGTKVYNEGNYYNEDAGGATTAFSISMATPVDSTIVPSGDD